MTMAATARAVRKDYAGRAPSDAIAEARAAPTPTGHHGHPVDDREKCAESDGCHRKRQHLPEPGIAPVLEEVLCPAAAVAEILPKQRTSLARG